MNVNGAETLHMHHYYSILNQSNGELLASLSNYIVTAHYSVYDLVGAFS